MSTGDGPADAAFDSQGFVVESEKVSPPREVSNTSFKSPLGVAAFNSTSSGMRIVDSGKNQRKMLTNGGSSLCPSVTTSNRSGFGRHVWWAEEGDDEHSPGMIGTETVSPAATGIYFVDVARQWAKKIIRHPLLDAVVACVIVGNSVCIALEQEFTLADVDTPILHAMEDVFVCIYLLELFLRFAGDGLAAFRDAWVLFDLAIVLVSVVTQWVLAADQVGEMRVVVLVRLARLARLARTARLFIFFRELWILVNGLVSSAGVMFWSLVLVALLIYFFALLGMELIAIKHATEGSSDPAVDDIVAQYFPSLLITMLTLTQFVTLDSISTIYRPLVRHDPVLALYFTCVVLAIGIVLMNLITAVLVNEALEQAQQNKEAVKVHEAKQKKKVLKELHAFFRRLDGDASGKVDLQEIMRGTPEDLEFIRGFVKATDLQEVFDSLDIDENGGLDVDEFCEGLYQAMISQRPLEFKRIDKRIEAMRGQVQEIRAMQLEVTGRITEMHRRFDMLLPNGPAVASESGAANRSVDSSPRDSQTGAADVLCELRKMRVELTCQVAAELAQKPLPTVIHEGIANRVGATYSKQPLTSSSATQRLKGAMQSEQGRAHSSNAQNFAGSMLPRQALAPSHSTEEPIVAREGLRNMILGIPSNQVSCDRRQAGSERIRFLAGSVPNVSSHVASRAPPEVSPV